MAPLTSRTQQSNFEHYHPALHLSLAKYVMTPTSFNCPHASAILPLRLFQVASLLLVMGEAANSPCRTSVSVQSWSIPSKRPGS